MSLCCAWSTPACRALCSAAMRRRLGWLTRRPACEACCSGAPPVPARLRPDSGQPPCSPGAWSRQGCIAVCSCAALTVGEPGGGAQAGGGGEGVDGSAAHRVGAARFAVRGGGAGRGGSGGRSCRRGGGCQLQRHSRDGVHLCRSRSCEAGRNRAQCPACPVLGPAASFPHSPGRRGCAGGDGGGASGKV